MKTRLLIPLFLLLVSCSKEAQQESIQKQENKIESKSVLKDSIVLDTVKKSPIPDTVKTPAESEAELQDLAQMFVDSDTIRTAEDKAPWLYLCSKDDAGQAHHDTLDSISAHLVEGLTERLTANKTVLTGALADLDGDNRDDLIVARRPLPRNGFKQDVDSLFIYLNKIDSYVYHQAIELYEMVPNIEFRRSMEIVDLHGDSSYVLYFHNSEGGSGGGHSVRFMRWGTDSLMKTNYLKSGKWISLDDVDNDGRKEIIFSNYRDNMNGKVHFKNDRYGVQIFHLEGDSFTDVSDKFLEYRERFMDRISYVM